MAPEPGRCWQCLVRSSLGWTIMLVTLGCGEDSKRGVSTSRNTGDPAKHSPGIELRGTALQFHDRTAKTGIAFTYHDGQEAGLFTILELLGGGAAAVDYDADGKVDLVFAGGGEFGPDRQIRGLRPGAFRNQGDWHFTRVDAAAGLSVAPFYNHGIAAGDFNNDGFPDLLLTGYGGLALYRNQGDGTFVEGAAAAGLTDDLWSSSAAWGDLNGDGFPDLYVVHYVNWSFTNDPICKNHEGQRDRCPPKEFEGLPHTLYVNRGDGTFLDVSRAAGLRPDGKGLGVLLADLDLDGRVDIYVANDTTPKFLYRNLGHLKFEEIGIESGASLNDRGDPDGSMGVDLLDFNLDGLPDLCVANFEGESFALYQNHGDFLYRHVSRSTGVMAVGGLYVGWGTVAADFDHDGDEDLFVSNGHANRFPTRATVKQLPLVFENLGNNRFISIAALGGECLNVPHLGRGVAAGDFDDDGDLDLALNPINEPALILANDSQTSNHWLALKLIGTQSSRDAVGAIIRIETPLGRQIRQIKGGGSYASTGDSRVFFGLGRADLVSRLEIRWPSGCEQTLSNVRGDQTLQVVEDAPHHRHSGGHSASGDR